MMKKVNAIVATGKGGPEVLEAKEIPLAWPRGKHDVLVRLRAAALNPADLYFRQLGAYVEGGSPLVLGHDGAGIAVETGPEVSRVSPGDKVCFCYGGIGGDPGTYAEFAVVHEDCLAPIPPQVSFAQAAALPLVAITAWEALYDRAAVAAGESVLVHGGAGGTGHIAVQLAKLKGARVAATVSTDEKADFVKDLGVERPIFYRREDFVVVARDWTGERGLDVALDNVGADAMRRTYRAMAPYGRVVTLMGTPADDEDETAYVSNLTIHNVMMLTPMLLGLQDRLAAQARIVTKALTLLAGGQIRVEVGETFALKHAADAHAKLETGGAVGKIVLEIG